MPTISKIFKRVIHMQLYDYFSENNLYCEQQYGFRSKHSAELATIKLVDYILMTMTMTMKTMTIKIIYLT